MCVCVCVQRRGAQASSSFQRLYLALTLNEAGRSLINIFPLWAHLILVQMFMRSPWLIIGPEHCFFSKLTLVLNSLTPSLVSFSLCFSQKFHVSKIFFFQLFSLSLLHQSQFLSKTFSLSPIDHPPLPSFILFYFFSAQSKDQLLGLLRL